MLKLLAESGDPDTHHVLRLHDFFYYHVRCVCDFFYYRVCSSVHPRACSVEDGGADTQLDLTAAWHGMHGTRQEHLILVSELLKDNLYEVRGMSMRTRRPVRLDRPTL